MQELTRNAENLADLTPGVADVPRAFDRFVVSRLRTREIVAHGAELRARRPGERFVEDRVGLVRDRRP
jgi:hypothetical protein